MGLFHDFAWLNGPELGPVRDYLQAADGDGLDRKRVQLAAELAALFDEYAFSRPEMLAAWREGALVPEADPGAAALAAGALAGPARSARPCSRPRGW